MTMAKEPAEDATLADEIFSSDREGRGGKEPQPESERDDAPTRDERGRFAARANEHEETQPAPQQSTVQQPTKQVADVAMDGQEAEAQPEGQHHVPLNELKAERKRRQDAERQFQELQQQQAHLLQLVQQSQRQAPQVQPQPEEAPDPFLDPQGYINHQLRQRDKQHRSDILDIYEDNVRARFGDEKVNAAFQAAQQAGVIEHIRGARNPWQALMSWHGSYLQRQEIGGDLEAFKKRIADEAVAKALAGLRQGGGTGAAPAQQQRFPGSLATATATGTQGAALTEQSIADDVFGSGRRRGGA